MLNVVIDIKLALCTDMIHSHMMINNIHTNMYVFHTLNLNFYRKLYVDFDLLIFRFSFTLESTEMDCA